ncbi:proton extrusion protein PcxA [Phormidium tenue]|uniref:Proton extrusion protein PxcA n=1 Tax=Phormidium tenue NIES-30 TaxID=549789 RepID=A0A1U7J3N4_9CYAN|nr:proton extrusion protein PcxA [Phormidium tenue]MBD2233387.1 proton extrusion protein PcxA [Phormidium tenue FACHB-1052]OKH46845.1 proton extrusion protein PcxA [Phormidium tenue NIES-30]
MQNSGFFRSAQRWVSRTPERALNQAYEAAQMIKAIEREYFSGNPISPRYGNYGDSAIAYFQSELKKYLNLIKVRMAVFRASRSVVRVTDPRMTEVQLPMAGADDLAVSVIDQQAMVFRKLQLIDEVLARYANLDTNPERVITLANGANGSLEPAPSAQVLRSRADQVREDQLLTGPNGAIAASSPPADGTRAAGLSDRVNVLPRSILRTVDRIRQDLDPNAEQEVIKEFRNSKAKTTAAIRFVLLLVIVPLLTQQFTKAFIVGPIVDRVRAGGEEVEVFLNPEMEEEALHELQQFEERLRFEVLIGKVPALSELNIEERVRDKAAEVEEEYRDRSASAVKNVFSDILAAIAFALLLIYRKQDVANIKAFMDEIVYGLSDSAKAFIIILFTDTFVGFHSPHGWEILLEGLSRHLGLPANRDFIFLFIATFPVILDTIFKYWIFRYLNRISPSAVATYKNMNE